MPGSPSTPPSARTAVLDFVRRGVRTVNALAEALGVTDNAVRLHLAALERDGLLKRSGVKRSGQVGQPAAEYELTPEGETSLSNAYSPALAALVAALTDKLDTRVRRSVFLEAGRKLAAESPSTASGSVAARAGACATLIESLGGSATIRTEKGRTVLVGAGCPLAAAVRAEPGTCAIIEALLARTSGLDVTQRCEHGARPSCRFELMAAR
jgi:predicted ArsR family transcriptional regulator